MIDTPFGNYHIEVDLEAETVRVEAWDDDMPDDTRHGIFDLEELEIFFRRLNRALSR